jgi:hypothetical protein
MRRLIMIGCSMLMCSACSGTEGGTLVALVRQASSSCATGDGAKTPFAGGSGTIADPYVICSMEQLDRIRGAYLSQNFALGTDLEASITNPSSAANSGSPWDNGGLGFEPIGNCGPDQACNTGDNINSGDDVSFTGTFDGLDHVISHLYIHRPAQVGAGLFGKIPEAATC